MKAKAKMRKLIVMVLCFVMVTGMLPVSVNAEENHVHTELCYANEGDLLCAKTEAEGHVHTEECLCSGDELICTLDESEEHTHDENCHCAGGETICGKEESEGHTHTEECYATGTELVCGQNEVTDYIDTALATPSLEEVNENVVIEENVENKVSDTVNISNLVTTADELKEAFANANDGDTITLGGNFDYDYAIHGTIVVDKIVTLDFNGYKITTTTGLFDVAATGDLTLVRAQVDSRLYSDDYKYIYGVINEVYGVLTIESTEGSGFDSRKDDSNQVDLVEDNYGKIIIKNGTFYPGSNLIYDVNNSGSVLIENAYVETPESRGYIVGYLNDDECSLIIESGEYKAGDYIVSGIYGGSAILKNGNYNGVYSILDDLNGGTLLIEDGTYKSGGNCFDIYEGNLTINGGSFTAGTSTENSSVFDDTSIDSSNNQNCTRTVNIKGGNFSSNGSVINSVHDTTFNLTGGTYTNTSGKEAFNVGVDTIINICDGYVINPVDWKESKASSIEIKSDMVTINFYVEGNLWKQVESVRNDFKLPGHPVNSDGYEFVCWEDELGNKFESIPSEVSELNLYAVFKDRTHTVTFDDKGTIKTVVVSVGTPINEVPGIERVDSGDGFYAWLLGYNVVDKNTTTPVFSDIVLTASYTKRIMSYEEMINAIKNKQEEISLGADITVPQEIIVDYNCVIEGNGFSLIRPEGYKDILLSVKNGAVDTEENNDVQVEKITLTVRNAVVDGSNIDALNSAVYANENTRLVMENTTVKNNRSSKRGYDSDWKWIDGNGGGIYISKSSIIELSDCVIENNYAAGNGGGIYFEDIETLKFDNCTIKNNVSENNGGGIFGDTDRNKKEINIYLNNCDILNNNSSGYEGGGGFAIMNYDGESSILVNINNCLIDGNEAENNGGGLLFYKKGGSKDLIFEVKILDSTISNNIAEYGGGLDITHTVTHLYGDTSIEYNKAKNGGASNSRNGGNVNDNIIYMHDNSSISYNEATEDGGALYHWEQLLVMYDDSSIHHNKAGNNGGAVLARSYGITQKGGTIRDNYAGNLGGGVYIQSSYNKLESGMIYDNIAGVAGDDLYSDNKDWQGVYEQQPSRIYGDGNSLKLQTVDIEKIEGYYEAPLEKISVPYDSWYIDGVEEKDFSKEHHSRYTTRDESIRICEEKDNLAFLKGKIRGVGSKAIWYGLVLAYDANYENTTDHMYDSQAYTKGTNAIVTDNIFDRDGYIFVGWNTQPDGKGQEYPVGSDLRMDNSMVLYAQWEKVYKVTYVVNGDAVYGTPSDYSLPVDTNKYKYEHQVIVKPNLITKQNYAMVDGEKVYGKWEFIEWDKDDFVITENTTITGVWKFTPDPVVTPNVPDKPITPNEPDVNEKPIVPDTPVKPNEPDVPVKPILPDTQNESNKPEVPSVSENSDKHVVTHNTGVLDIVPNTGDNSIMGVWITLVCLSAIGIVTAVIGKKRNKK